MPQTIARIEFLELFIPSHTSGAFPQIQNHGRESAETSVGHVAGRVSFEKAACISTLPAQKPRNARRKGWMLA